MSANRPAFAKSLVAMYGSSPETSDDEDHGASSSNDDHQSEEAAETCQEPEPCGAVAPSETCVDGDDKSEIVSDAVVDSPKPVTGEEMMEAGVPESLAKISTKSSDEDTKSSDEDGEPIAETVPDITKERAVENEEAPDTTPLQEVDELLQGEPSNSVTDTKVEDTVVSTASSPEDHKAVDPYFNKVQMDECESMEPGDYKFVKSENTDSDQGTSTDLEAEPSKPRIECDPAVHDSVKNEEAGVQEESKEVENVSQPTSDTDSSTPPNERNPDSSSDVPPEEYATCSDGSQTGSEKRKRSPSPDKSSTVPPGGRRLRQIRNPSVKAAEAAADAAFVAAVTPTRKNLKEAKIACALAKVSDSADVSSGPKKNVTTRARKGRSSSHERLSLADSRASPLVFSMREDSNTSDNSNSGEGKLSSISEEGMQDAKTVEEEETLQGRNSFTEAEKPLGIKLKISRESVQILDPNLSKLEVQIPTESLPSDFSSSPGGTKRMRKLKEGTLSPIAPQSPITLKIAKSKEGLEVVPSESMSQSVSGNDPETGKVEKITLKLSSRDDSATIVKASGEESSEGRSDKLTRKFVKEDGSKTFSSACSQDDVEETKLGKITLKLSKNDVACIVKKKETDASFSENEGAKVERITLKVSNDKNVSIVRSKDVASLERGASASPEPGKVEKITLKVFKNDNVSIVKPASPTPSTVGIEKLTLKVSKDGTAAVSAKQHDELPRDCESSKLEKITLKLSKDNEGVSIVKPVSPVPDRKGLKATKEEPLSPLSPLIISRSEDAEPQKERITLKLAKAGGYPSPVGVVDERSSWSIKSNDSENMPSPVASEVSTPKSRSKRALNEVLEGVPHSAKRLKLSDLERTDSADSVIESEAPDNIGEVEVQEEKVSKVLPVEPDTDIVPAEEVLGESSKSGPAFAEPSAEDSMDVILLDSEDSQSGAAAATSDQVTSIPVIEVDSETPTTKSGRRKPRGRPRRQVLTPGAIPVVAPVPGSSPVEESSPTPSPTKSKREKTRPEPVECDRPKRSCKGREKPPPKPPAKPRGRAAALAKQKAEQSMQPEEPQLFEEETRMSADCSGQTDVSVPDPELALVGSTSNGLVAKVVVARLSSNYASTITTPTETPDDSPGPVIINEESQASQGSLSLVSSTTESTPNRGNRKGRMEINVDPEAQAEFTVDMIAEYMWPLNDGNGETYMIQEQISAYLGVKSFKRKYPNMQRRTVDHDERQYLLERKLVSESLCDLGLTALPSHEVLDVLCTDFPEKFEEYRRFTRERVQRELSNKQRAMLSAGPSGKEDSKSKAIRNMASFNAMLNRSRRDQRRCCFDLQSFTVHYPENRRRRMAVPNPPSVGAYPIALVPGQYTDYYKEYTAAELRYFPVNTVLYGPLLPHEMMKPHAGGSDGSQTDSSDSSSSDSSSSDSDSSDSDSDSDSNSSSESGDELTSQMGPGPVDSQESEVDRPDAVCRVCSGDRLKNKLGNPEALVHCASCEKSGHLSCLDLTVDMMPHIRKYSWHCTDCKLCAQCNDTADEDKMLFCDMCDRGYHIYCVGLRKVPEGRWHCQECAVCASCAARDPGGTEEHQATQSLASPDNTPSKVDAPQWQHEFKKGDKGTRLYVRTLCVPCSKLWRKGRYCRLCWKCFTNQPEEEGLINCSICDRWMHADCCRKAGRVIDADKLGSYICELCQQKGVSKSPSKMLR